MPEEEKEVAIDCTNPDVVTKYRLAGDIAAATLQLVLKLCKNGAKIVDICSAGDGNIVEATGKVYKGKKVEKGIGFPTCLSVNNVVGHFSPTAEDTSVLKTGDVCKIDLGVQVDGYTALVAHTIVIGEEGPATEPVKGKAADVMAAAYFASECAIRMLKIGAKNSAITEMIEKVAADFKVNPVRGVLSHQLEQFVIDGDKTIINKAGTEEKVEEFDFAPHEVYAMDIVMTTGEGKPKEVDERTTVFKRITDASYQLKMKASRAILSTIKTRFPTFPFTMRAFTEKTARFGIKECVDHDLVRPYPVLLEKEGELVSHVKFTALLLPNGTIRITGPGMTPEMFSSEYSVTDADLKALLLTSATKKKKNNKKKKKKPAAAVAAE